MEKWILKGGRGSEYAASLSVNPLLGKILSARMSLDEAADFLSDGAHAMNPYDLPDMEEAVGCITGHIQKGSRIRIIGDYDVDGISATAILYLGLSAMGAEVDCRIPERIGEGYGFSQSIAAELVADGIKLAITCDNGIREFERADYLSDKGIDLVITDHHELERLEDGSDRLPLCRAAVNAHRKASKTVFSDICGAYTALLLIEALKARFELSEGIYGQLVGYAALGTVCDVMPLLADNRRLVRDGLKFLNDSPTVGISALCEAGHVKELTPYTVGFVIGPMLNAGGRLSSQNQFIHLLIGNDPAECRKLANELAELNRERQRMTEEGLQTALNEAGQGPEPVKVIYLPELHESIAGLVAGKLKERLYRPVFVVTKGEEGLKGSGRSIPAYSMFEEMCRVSDLFTKFGGHPMAAGFSLHAEPGREKEAVDEMRRRLNETVRLTEEELCETVTIDAAVNMQDFTLSAVQSLSCLEPFGTGNPRPLFAQKNVLLRQIRPLGAEGKVLRLTLQQGGKSFEAILFKKEKLSSLGISADDCPGGWLEEQIPLDMCYCAEVDTYGYQPRVKFIIQNIRRA